MIKIELTDENKDDITSYFYDNTHEILQSIKGLAMTFGIAGGLVNFFYDSTGFFVAQEEFDEMEEFLEVISDY